jgi:hypothetical protein
MVFPFVLFYIWSSFDREEGKPGRDETEVLCFFHDGNCPVWFGAEF